MGQLLAHAGSTTQQDSLDTRRPRRLTATRVTEESVIPVRREEAISQYSEVHQEPVRKLCGGSKSPNSFAVVDANPVDDPEEAHSASD